MKPPESLSSHLKEEANLEAQYAKEIIQEASCMPTDNLANQEASQPLGVEIVERGQGEANRGYNGNREAMGGQRVANGGQEKAYEDITLEPVADKRDVRQVKEYIEKKAIGLAVAGLTTRETAHVVGVSDHKVRNLMSRYSGFKDVNSLLKSVGVVASSVAARGWTKILERIETEGDTIALGSLAVISGIATQRGRELLDRPEPPTVPDYNQLSSVIPTDSNEPTLAT